MSEESEALGAIFGAQDAQAGGGRGVKWALLDSYGKAAYDRAYNSELNKQQLKEVQKSNELLRKRQIKEDHIEQENRQRQWEFQQKQNKIEQAAQEAERLLIKKNNLITEYISKYFRKHQNELITLSKKLDTDNTLEFNYSSKLLLFGMLLNLHFNKNHNSTNDLPIPFLKYSEIDKFIDDCSEIHTNFENQYNATPLTYFNTLTAQTKKLIDNAESEFIDSLNKLIKVQTTLKISTYYYPDISKIKYLMNKSEYNYNLWGDLETHSRDKISKKAILRSKNKWIKIQKAFSISYFNIPSQTSKQFNNLAVSEIQEYRVTIKQLLTKYNNESCQLHNDSELEDIEILIDLLNESHSNLSKSIKNISLIHSYPKRLKDSLFLYVHIMKILLSNKDLIAKELITYEEDSSFVKSDDEKTPVRHMPDTDYSFDILSTNQILKEIIGSVRNIQLIGINLKNTITECITNNLIIHRSMLTATNHDISILDKNNHYNVTQDLPNTPFYNEVNSHLFKMLLFDDANNTYKAIKSVKSLSNARGNFLLAFIYIPLMWSMIGKMLIKFGWIENITSMINWFTISVPISIILLLFKDYLEYYKLKTFKLNIKRKCKSMWTAIFSDLQTYPELRNFNMGDRLKNKCFKIKKVAKKSTPTDNAGKKIHSTSNRINQNVDLINEKEINLGSSQNTSKTRREIESARENKIIFLSILFLIVFLLILRPFLI